MRRALRLENEPGSAVTETSAVDLFATLFLCSVTAFAPAPAPQVHPPEERVAAAATATPQARVVRLTVRGLFLDGTGPLAPADLLARVGAGEPLLLRVDPGLSVAQEHAAVGPLSALRRVTIELSAPAPAALAGR